MQRFYALAFLWVIQLWPVAGEETYQFLGQPATLDNGVVTLQVSPKVGRIIAYHRKNEANWLVIDDRPVTPGWHWNPWGGDRLWPTSQALFLQIYGNDGCDPILDGAPWSLEKKTATSLELKSGVSLELGLQITRRIELVPKSTEVVQTFRLERVKSSPFPVHLWSITAVRGGDSFLMESDPAVKHPGGKAFKWWPDASPTAPQATLLKDTHILQVPWPATKLKLGTYGKWVALVSGTSAFVESIGYDPHLLYLEGSSLQAYVDPERKIYEMETLSPSWFLQEGEAKEWKVRWRLVEFPEGTKSEAERGAYLNTVVEGK